MKWPLPVSSRWSSRRLTGWPAPKRRLPGRMFIALSLRFRQTANVADRQGTRQALSAVIPGRASARTRNLEFINSRFRVHSLRSCPGMTNEWLPDLAQHRFHGRTLLGRQRLLRRDGIADLIARDRQRGLEEGGEIIARKALIPPPQLSLKHQGLVPALRL